MEWEVQIVESAKDFILKLEKKMRAKIYRTINLLKMFGLSLTKPHSKRLKGVEKLRELRVKHSNNICRLFYFFYKDKIFIITSGYIKKSKKTSKKEIEKALKKMNKILEEKDENI